jgi:hypothetical protein
MAVALLQQAGAVEVLVEDVLVVDEVDVLELLVDDDVEVDEEVDVDDDVEVVDEVLVVDEVDVVVVVDVEVVVDDDVVVVGSGTCRLRICTSWRHLEPVAGTAPFTSAQKVPALLSQLTTVPTSTKPSSLLSLQEMVRTPRFL